MTSADFSRLKTRCIRWSDENFSLIAQVRSPNTNHALGLVESPRLGLVVSRKYGNAAQRNSFKRCVREVFRTQLKHDLANTDFIVIAKPKARELVDLRLLDAALLAGVRNLQSRVKSRLNSSGAHV